MCTWFKIAEWVFGLATVICGGISQLSNVSQNIQLTFGVLAIIFAVITAITAIYEKFFALGVSQKDLDAIADAVIQKFDARERNMPLVNSKQELKDTVRTALERVIRETPKKSAMESLRLLRQNNNADELIGLLKKCSSDAEAKRTLATKDIINRQREIMLIAYLTGSLEIAQQAIDKVLGLDPYDVSSINLSGHIALNMGQLDKAEKAYKSLVEMQDKNTQALGYGGMGLVYIERGD